ncbi:MAG TPA: hypothetical protein VFE91_07375 [Nitrososphaerales archaeon]|nr:hypothetical protein [Nitrososphaerales archaeon]
MSRSGNAGDLSAVLYLVPFIVSGAYGLVLWVQSGISVLLPSNVYLTVTRDPIIFAIGTLAVLGGVIIDVRSSPPQERTATLSSLSNTLQSLAAASLILVLFSAVYANGFTDLSSAATDFIVGRYGLVFPVMLVLLSYLVSARFQVEALFSPRVLAVVALLLVPVSIYEIGKRQTALGLTVALVLLIVGLYLFIRKPRSQKQEKQ